MIKKSNGKKKKGFTLIELIIVLAVMAIIALIAIPNFSAVRDNSKVKADKQSCATIERTVLMLVADETIKDDGNIVVTFDSSGKIQDPSITGELASGDDAADAAAVAAIKDALQEVKAPQAGPNFEREGKAVKYEITITDGSVKADTK